MLKTTEQAPPPPPDLQPGEPSIGDLASRLVDDGKAYAKAELEVARATAIVKANALRTPAILFAVAAFVAMAALNALAVAIFVTLDRAMHPLLAGLVAFLLIGSVAGILAWAGYAKLRKTM